MDTIERDTVTIRLGFTAEELAGRRSYIGGSDAGTLMTGDDDAIHDLWMRKTGRGPEPDLSDALPVQMGIWTEELNARWYQKITGRAARSRNVFCPHPAVTFMAANLDGLTTTAAGDPAVLECKHVNAFSNVEDVIQRYMAQVHHGAYCAEVEHAVLSIFVGTLKYEVAEVAIDTFYLAQLIDREKAFWACVETDTAPPRMKPIAAPVPVSEWREVDLSTNNFWCENAAVYLDTLPHRKRNQTAEKELKALVDADVKLAYGAGIRVTRAKNNALSIREEK